MQQLILGALRSVSTPITENEICWRTAASEGAIEYNGTFADGVRTGAMAPAHYKSFMRAIRALEEDKKVKVRRRRLATADEVQRSYPFRTRRVEVHELRSRVLGPLIELAKKHRPVTADHAREDELFLYREGRDEVTLAAWAAQWHGLRERLVTAFQRASTGPERDLLLGLLCKGTVYFDLESNVSMRGERTHKLTHTRTFGSLLGAAQSLLDDATLEGLTDLYRSAVPHEEHEARTLKDLLFRIAVFHTREEAGLKVETMHDLLRLEPELVRGMPGFVVAGKRRTFFEEGRTQFDPHLRHIVDRHVFDKFTFLMCA